MDTETTLKAGDICLDCKELGLEKYLRYFKINLNGDTLLKCESNECMFPYNDEISSSDEEEEVVDNLTETNSLQFIDEFIQQCNNGEDIRNTNDIQINDNISEQATQFDITFLDDFNEIENKSICKPNILVESDTYLDNNYISMPILNPLENDMCVNTKASSNTPINMCSDNTKKRCSNKINIQSIETIKFENPQYIHLPASSIKYIPTTVIGSKISNSTDTSIVQHTTCITSAETVSKLIKKPQTNSKTRRKSKTTSVSNIEHSSNSTSSELSDLNTEPLTKSNSSDIPKAAIAKGNALLKKLSKVVENSGSTKFKGVRKNNVLKKTELKKQEESTPSTSNGLDYTFDKISQLLMANKMKK